MPLAPRRGNRNWLMFALGAAVVLWSLPLLCLPTVPWLHRPNYSTSHLLWSSLFSNNQDTFVVPADSGLGISAKPYREACGAGGLRQRKISLQREITGDVDDANLDDLRTQRYTSIADLTITARAGSPAGSDSRSLCRCATRATCAWTI